MGLSLSLRSLAGLAALASASAQCSGTTYDYFMLVEQWAITQCMDVFNCSANMTETTLHGLWPSILNSKTYPCTCTDEAFNPANISTIEAEMDIYWPTLSTTTNDDFWSHEWTKHGTCALDVLPSQFAYFDAALAARAKYDVVAALMTAGHPPSNTQGFTLAELNGALATAYGADVVSRVSCDSSGNIQELSLCFDKAMKPLACPISAAPGACTKASTRTLYLPATMTRL